jgi:ubiquinone/menaquinone biosynthesis C-methylase UbiE
MSSFVEHYCKFPVVMRRPMWRIWHKLLIRFDKDEIVNFMNYGYADLNGNKLKELNNEDEQNRYCIQLYDHVVNKVDLENKEVVEVGSGRGGGADFISRYYRPETYTGIDISEDVIKFCNRNYSVKGLSFLKGRAEKIPVNNESCDAVVNVESARCYSSIGAFFKEVHRILRYEGHFLFADMIEKHKVDEMKKELEENGFEIKHEKEITPNVAKGLELDNIRREKIIQHRIPGFLRSAFKSFAGTKGTVRYNSFNNGKYEYWSFVLTKRVPVRILS